MSEKFKEDIRRKIGEELSGKNYQKLFQVTKMQLKAVIVQKLHKVRRHTIAGRLAPNLVVAVGV